MADNPEELKRLKASPELFRARAQSGATLSMTAAAAITTGLVVRSGSGLFPVAGGLGVATIILLMISVGGFAASAQTALSDEWTTLDQAQEIERLLKTIRSRIRVGQVAGVLAIAASAALVLAVVFEKPPLRLVDIRPVANAQFPTTCPSLADGMIRGHVDQRYAEADQPMLWVKLDGDTCGPDQRIAIRRTDVASIVEVDL